MFEMVEELAAEELQMDASVVALEVANEDIGNRRKLMAHAGAAQDEVSTSSSLRGTQSRRTQSEVSLGVFSQIEFPPGCLDDDDNQSDD